MPMMNSGHRGSAQGGQWGFYSTQLGGENFNPAPSRNHYEDLSPGLQISPHGEQRDIPDQYGYGQPQHRSTETELSLPNQQQQPTSSSIDLGEIQELARPEDEEPWTGTGPAYGPDGFSSGASRIEPTSWTVRGNCTKAVTVANQREAESLQRPRFSSRTSFPASLDSGFESAKHTLSQDLPSTPHKSHHGLCNFPTTHFGNFHAHGAPRRPPSVKSDSHLQVPSGVTKARRTKTAASPCEVCGRLLKNHSDAQYAFYVH